MHDTPNKKSIKDVSSLYHSNYQTTLTLLQTFFIIKHFVFSETSQDIDATVCNPGITTVHTGIFV